VGLSADLGLCKENLFEVEQQRTHIAKTTRIPPIRLNPEYASAVTLPRISSESVKKMALAQRKKAF
jgi:hypothetical protein